MSSVILSQRSKKQGKRSFKHDLLILSCSTCSTYHCWFGNQINDFLHHEFRNHTTIAETEIQTQMSRLLDSELVLTYVLTVFISHVHAINIVQLSRYNCSHRRSIHFTRTAINTIVTLE